MFFDRVSPCDSKVDPSFANESGDVCGGEEDQSNGVVLDESDVEARMAVELDVATGQKVKCRFVQASL